MWFLFALLSSVFAALTSILAKVGIEGVNSNLATAVRTVVVVIMAWVVVFMTNTQSGLPDIGRKSWIFLILSGLLDLLLQGAADGGSLQGGARRQVQHRAHRHPGFSFPA